MKNILTAAALILMAATLHNIFAATPDTPPAAAHGATVTSETPTQPKATDANIYGHIISLDRQEHIPYVTVSVKGTTIGTTADATGHYYLKNLPEGPCTIVAEAIGYSTVEQQVVMKRNKTVELNFVMQEQTLAMDEVVVSATRNVTNKRSSAVIVNVASAKLFDRTASTDLAETMKFQSGLRIENNCGNCGTTQLRINGLEGQYSQILLDSNPIFSSLAAVLSFLATFTSAPVLYVHGNHDECYQETPPSGCICIDDSIYVYKGIRILGLGGSMRYKEGTYQYTEWGMRRRIARLWFQLLRRRGFDILVTHAPAYQLNDGRDLPHQGFESFLKLMDKYKPRFFLHGHVHMSYGRKHKRYDKYQDTHVINAFERCVFDYEDEHPEEHIR